MIELLIDNRDGEVLAIPVASFSWTTTRNEVGEFEAELVIKRNTGIEVAAGAVVRVKDGTVGIFYGYVFEVSGDDTEIVKIKAYDQMRYLKNVDTFVFPAQKASDTVKKVATHFGLKLGNIEDTIQTLPALVEDEQEGLDVIMKHLHASLLTHMRFFNIYDDFGKLTLKGVHKSAIKPEELFIGDKSLMESYEWSHNISEAVNRVKLVQDNKETNKREVYIAQDSGNIAKWGLLQQFENVDEKLNPAQIKAMADNIIKNKNRIDKKMSVTCIGNWVARAGRMIPVYLAEQKINYHMMIEKCVHSYEGGIHRMELEMKVVT